jgi:hypothetical protein
MRALPRDSVAVCVRTHCCALLFIAPYHFQIPSVPLLASCMREHVCIVFLSEIIDIMSVWRLTQCLNGDVVYYHSPYTCVLFAVLLRGIVLNPILSLDDDSRFLARYTW